MAITIPGSVTGSAQTGFTTPGYTTTVDTPLSVNSKQSAVTALTGTQAGASAHTVSKPFILYVSKPAQPAVLGKPNPTTGLIAQVPNNVYTVGTTKGVLPLAGQPNAKMTVRTIITVPAGADTADAAEIRAALSAHIGLVSSVSAGMGDTAINGVM